MKDILDTFEPEIARAFAEAVERITDDVRLDLLQTAIRDGNVQQILNLVPVTGEQVEPLRIALQNTYAAAGNYTVSNLRKRARKAGLASAVGFFDSGSPHAVQWLQDLSSRLVVEIGNDTRSNLQSLIARSTQLGHGPRRTALDIVGRLNNSTRKREGGIVGLTRQQYQWSVNAEDELNDPTRMNDYLKRDLRDRRFDPTVRRAIRDDKPIPQGKIAAMTSRYRARTLMYRGQNIARTEVTAAASTAQQHGVDKIIRDGVVDSQDVKRIWDAANDAFVRNSHAFMDGQVRGPGEPFVDGEGLLLQYPGDRGAPARTTINCRCFLRLDVDFVASAKRRGDF